MMTEIPIMTLNIQNELDVVLAYRRGMQFARFSGMRMAEQTRFATAVSEICRNSLEYAGKGSISYSIVKTPQSTALFAIIQDEGKGISNLAEIIERKPGEYKGRGLGIVYAKRLADEFKITSNGKGTLVHIKKIIPAKNPPINKLIIHGWLKHLQNEPVASPYEELKMQNLQLVELTEELRQNGEVVENQMQEISLLNDKLFKSNERMKEFTHAISHDLKTPLTSLKLAAGLLETKANSKGLSYQDIIKRSVNRLDKTISSLNEIIDIQHQENHIAKDLDFKVLFLDAQEEFADQIKEAKAHIQADFSTAPSIRYIEAYLHSLFHNLLSNSLKYKDPDKDLHISVNTKETAGGIILSFKDNGIGMDMKKIKGRLFVPFNRFSDQTEGKGIGLYMVKSMVEQNGGTVAVESKIGKGADFHFQLKPYY